MVNKALLKQLYSLSGELRRCEQKLDRLDRTRKLYDCGSDTDPFVLNKRALLREEAEAKYAHYLHELNRHREDLQESLRFIAAIPVSLTRQVFTLRYLEGETWQQISVELGQKHSADALRMRHNQYLRTAQGNEMGGSADGEPNAHAANTVC